MKHPTMQTVVILLVCSFFLVSEADAGNRAGSVSGQFLKLPVNARATALGNAQVSLAEGAGSVAYNPAGILSVANVSFGATYHQWFADITHSFFGVAANFQEWGSVGIGVMVLTTDDMLVRTPEFPEGTGEKFKAADFAYTFAYGRQISQEFALGLSVKYIQSYLFNKTIGSKAVAFDIGTLYDIPILRTRLGISVNNLGQDLKYINEQYSLPTALRFGAKTTVFEEDIHRVFVAIQFGRPNDADEQYNLGVEYVFQEFVSLRGGYGFNYDTQDFSGGLGAKLTNLGIDGQLDYAYTHFKFLPATHMFTIEIGF
ncbi:MAG: PorV/PorQ family protein [Bacteroidota bacterium]